MGGAGHESHGHGATSSPPEVRLPARVQMMDSLAFVHGFGGSIVLAIFTAFSLLNAAQFHGPEWFVLTAGAWVAFGVVEVALILGSLSE
jgi:hypothetical protein